MKTLFSRSKHQPEPVAGPWRKSAPRTLLLAILLIACATPFVSDSTGWTPVGAIQVAQAQEPDSTLESIGVPMPGMGIPSTNMWVEGNLLYGEALDPATWEAPFFAYDITKREVVFIDKEHADIHTKQRNIMVDNEGNAYFSVNETGIAKYDPRANEVTVLKHKLPNFLRASTRESSDGWIYGASGQGAPTDLFRFNPKQDVLEVLGPSWGYTTTMVMDPTDRYVYYVPQAHGGASWLGTPVLQYDTRTNEHKVIAFLHPFLEEQTGRVFDGTFGMAIDPTGRQLFISMRTYTGKYSNETAIPGLVVVNIPPQEAAQAVVPGIQFQDVTLSSGLGPLLSNSYIHSSSWGDVNGDGWLDLFVGTFVGSSYPQSGSSSSKNDPGRLLTYQNGVFQDSGQSSVAISGRSAGSVFVDLDNDGDLDLFVSNNAKTPEDRPSQVFKNDNGTLSLATNGSGIEVQNRDGRQVGVLDYNGDGLLDLLVLGGFHVPGPTVLLKNMGNFKFEDVTAEAGLPTDIHGLGLAIGDVTGNGWPDIFVAGGPTRSDQHNYMFIANGDGTYRPLQDHPFDWNPYALNNEDWAGGATFGDLNRDAKLDLLVGQHFGSAENTGAPLRVYVNRGLQGKDPVFEDITARSGVPKIFSKAPHVEIQDFDNDGWPDLYTSVRIDTPAGPEPLIFTHNGDSGDPTFSSPDIVNPYYYPGGPVADFNNDGKLDVLLPRVDTRLLQNVGAPGNWLKVRVNFETGPNQYGIGAKVRVYKQGTDQLLGFREISASSGFSSSQPPEAHFGLSNEQLVDVVVSMPFGGPEYRKTSVPVNGSIVMPLGDVDTPAHLGLETIAQTGTSPQLLQGPPGLPPHTVASTAPVIDFAIFPIPDYPGVPWSQWGQGVGASNGKFYTAIGDHIKDSSGNSYLYEYDPATRVLKSVGDLTSAVGSGPGKGGHFGKVHGQINEGKDGYLYFTSYWGSQDSAAQDPGYEGSVIFRYPVQSTAAGAPGDIQPPGSVTPDNAAGESPSTVPDEVEDTPAPSDSSNEPPASSATPPADSAVHPGNTAGESPSDVPDEIEDTPALSDSSNGPSAPSETPTADSAEPPSPAGSGGGMCSFASMKMAGLDSSWLLLGLLVPGLILARRYRLIRNFSSRKSE